MVKPTVLSRHRLPDAYRYSIVALWLAPIFLLISTVIIGKGITPAIFDLRLLMPLVLMALPAFYIWREGVDVLSDGIRVRIHIPRSYSYTTLHAYTYDTRRDRHVLTVWDVESRKVLECRAGHLTDFPRLLASLKTNVRWRTWLS